MNPRLIDKWPHPYADDAPALASALRNTEALEARILQLNQLLTKDTLLKELCNKGTGAEKLRAMASTVLGRNNEQRGSSVSGASQAGGQTLIVVLGDVDHFKLVNDTYGHPVGDQTLIKVAESLKAVFRRSADMAARWGGEEILAATIHDNRASNLTAQNEALLLAERLRFKIESQRIRMNNGVEFVEFGVTCSFGIAYLHSEQAPGLTVDDAVASLVSQADMALYAAKRNGRNRVYQFDQVLGIPVGSPANLPRPQG